MDSDEIPPEATKSTWQHATVSFPGGDGVPPEAAAALSTALSGQRFWFLRKHGELRLRTEAPPNRALDQLVTDGLATTWVSGIDEPETQAFGGVAGMDVAHDLFCADSPIALADTGRPGSRERCVLLISAMNRAAGLDRFEAGDVWAKVAAARPTVDAPTGPRRDAAVAAMRRLMNADATKLDNAEPTWPGRVAAFEEAGRRLAQLAADGPLTRGLRAVLAHHAMFTFNRGAVPVTEQAAAAWLAQQVAFADDAAAVSTDQYTAPASTVLGMEITMKPSADAAGLREALVAKLVDGGVLRTPEIIDAFRTVPRHVFVPDIDTTTAYTDEAVSVKSDASGEMISAISQPTVVATQLEQLNARPGHKVLEAGAATGYNAALLAHLVAPEGHVWTVDVDQDLVNGAMRHLADAGVSNVTALLGDGATGLPTHAPYDRIQFTVGAGDIPTAVLDQLSSRGRLVIPMRIRGSISRSFAFERDGQTWRSVSTQMATFMPLRNGICDDEQTMIALDGPGDVRIQTFTEQDVDRDAIRTALDRPSHKTYSGVKFRKGSAWEWLYLWLACSLPNGLSRMPGKRPGFTPHFSWGSMAALDNDTLAYLTVREGTDEDGAFWEIGVIGHGSRAASLTDEVVTAITEWDHQLGNDAPAPTFRLATGGARESLKATDSRFVIDKPNSRLVVDWR